MKKKKAMISIKQILDPKGRFGVQSDTLSEKNAQRTAVRVSLDSAAHRSWWVTVRGYLPLQL